MVVGADATADQVWRYPSHSPEDICVLEAIEPPAGYRGSAKQSRALPATFAAAWSRDVASRPFAAEHRHFEPERVREFPSGGRPLGANRWHLSSNACCVLHSYFVLNTCGDLDGDEICWCP